MMKVNNKVESISTIDTESRANYLDQFKEFTSRPESQINQKNEISQPITDQLNETYEDIRLDTGHCYHSSPAQCPVCLV